jgi:hypothetical protein
MKKPLVLLILLVSFFVGYGQKSSLSPTIKKFKNDTIIWKKDSLLKKEDFKSKGKGKNGPLGYTNTFLFLYPNESNGVLVFSVEAVFVMSKSYITQYSDYILKHEQLHFDICELYARKLRKMIADKDFKKVHNVQEVIQQMYNKVSAEFIKEEDKYDNDTNHGLNAAKQQVWADDIQKQLQELDAYSSTEVNTVK